MQDLTSGIIARIELMDFLQSLWLAAIYALILGFVIKRYSTVIGNRSQYLVVLLTLMPTMVLVITVVKSSLALSLGLVGALSIVRFRTPIKEPEELTHLFIAIAVGLGLGAGQVLATSVAFFFVILVLVVAGRFRKKHVPQGLFMEINGDVGDGKKSFIDSICRTFRERNVPFELRRYFERSKNMSATFFVEIEHSHALEDIMNDMKEELGELTFTIIDRSRQLG